jgi:Uma2 family endonuclease
LLVDRLRGQVGHSCHVRQEQPLTLKDSEPEPDIAVVPGSVEDYRSAHPSTAVLIIEVAVSSEDVDREKAELYASAGIEEYWLVLPQACAVEVFTDATDAGYANSQRFSERDTISPHSFPAMEIDLGRVFS